MRHRRILILAAVIIFAALVSACTVNYRRVAAERSNDTVEIVIDNNDVERLSVFSKVPGGKILSQMRTAGVVSVAISEDLPSTSDNNYLSGTDPKKVNIYLPTKGLSAAKIREIKASGLNVIPRIRNSFEQSASLISKKVSIITGRTVIFAEEEVLGYPNYLKEAAKDIKSKGINYGFIEFGKQLGDTTLASYMGSEILKVHSIPIDEMEGLTRDEMVTRFIRAARERDIRILYVHLIQYPDNGKDLVSTNTAFIGMIRSDLERSGFKIGPASKPGTVKLSATETRLMSAGIACVTLLLIACFMKVAPVWSLVVFMIVLLLPVKFAALLAAIVFPSYGVITAFPTKKEEYGPGVISRSISMTMNVAGVTAAGAVIISALFADKIAMLGIDSFIGVKAAFILPILIVAAYFLLRDDSGKIELKGAVPKIIDILNTKITLLYILIFLLASAAAALLILRSGNFGMPVSGGEKFARGMLENMLSVRPRTKEFLIGYPALILASIYYLKGGRNWLWALLSIGVLAPISLINTFCHTHSPILISITRSCIGIILGVAAGLAAYFVIEVSARTYKGMMK